MLLPVRGAFLVGTQHPWCCPVRCAGCPFRAHRTVHWTRPFALFGSIGRGLLPFSGASDAAFWSFSGASDTAFCPFLEHRTRPFALFGSIGRGFLVLFGSIGRGLPLLSLHRTWLLTFLSAADLSINRLMLANLPFSVESLRKPYKC